MEMAKRPVLPLKTRVGLFVLNAVTDASRRADGTVNRRLLNMATTVGSMMVPANAKPRNGVKTSDVAVGDASRGLWFRLFVPTNSDAQQQLPVVVFFHGGGFVYLGPDSKPYDDVCRRFARKLPAVVVSVSYRLAPENRYPAQYEDGFDVLKFIDERRNILPENADVARCFLAGDSAGGNLAHHVAVRAATSPFSRLKVVGIVAIQPFFGGEERTRSEISLAGIDPIVTMERTDFMWNALMAGGESTTHRDHAIINVSGPNAADLSQVDLPATMVVVAGFDSLKDWQKRYYEWLKNSGKEAYLLEYPNMIHAFYIFPELPESSLLIFEIKSFVANSAPSFSRLTH